MHTRMLNSLSLCSLFCTTLDMYYVLHAHKIITISYISFCFTHRHLIKNHGYVGAMNKKKINPVNKPHMINVNTGVKM